MKIYSEKDDFFDKNIEDPDIDETGRDPEQAEILDIECTEDSVRLDVFLASCITEYSRSYIKKLITEGKVRVDGDFLSVFQIAFDHQLCDLIQGNHNNRNHVPNHVFLLILHYVYP
jgi:RNA-binding protein YlmH